MKNTFTPEDRKRIEAGINEKYRKVAINPEGSFDIVISNGVFNLVLDKEKALKEVFRVLKPKGRFMIADQELITEPPADVRDMIETWAG